MLKGCKTEIIPNQNFYMYYYYYYYCRCCCCSCCCRCFYCCCCFFSTTTTTTTTITTTTVTTTAAASFSKTYVIMLHVFIYYRQRKTKALSRLCRCACCSAPLLFVYGRNCVSHGAATVVLQTLLNACETRQCRQTEPLPHKQSETMRKEYMERQAVK